MLFSLEKTYEVIGDGREQNVKSRTVNIIWFFRLFFLFIRSKRLAHSSREHLSSLCSQSRRAIAQKWFLPPLKDWDAAASKVNWALLRPHPLVLRLTFRRRTSRNYSRTSVMERRGRRRSQQRRSSPMDNIVSFIAEPWRLEDPWDG